MADIVGTGTCKCGRSPTGDCNGWHALRTDDYLKKLQEHERKRQVAEAKEKLSKSKADNGKA